LALPICLTSDIKLSQRGVYMISRRRCLVRELIDSFPRGAAFTIMVVGESGLGKTTFINTLFSTTIKNYAEHRLRHKKQMDKTVLQRVRSDF
jgi:septin family protein